MANPHWRIWVDWNENGTWGEASGDYLEEITGDVLELGWQWGRPLELSRSSRRYRPARLDLTLRNDTLKYTPGNARSPLAGHLAAGRRVWAAWAWPHDNFTGGDGGDINGRVVSLGSGQTWVKETSGPAGVALSAGMAQPTAGAGGAIYTMDFGDSDAHMGFIYRRNGDGKSGMALRVLNQWDYLRVRFGDSGTVLEDVTFGFPSFLRRGDPLETGRDYFIEVEMHGSSVRLYATDLSDGGMDRREILDGGGNAGNPGGTKHGLWHDGSAAAAADRWGSFGGWRSFFHGALARLSPERDPELGSVCRCQVRDDLELLGSRTLYNLLNRRNGTSGYIANSILTWAGYGPNYRRVEGGGTLVGTEPRALWRLPVSSALASLEDEENGRVYMDGRGYFRLESSAHRGQGAHTTARATLRDVSDSPPFFAALEWDEGREGVENPVEFRYRLNDNQGLQEIWRLRDVPAIPAGESRDFLAESQKFEVADSIRVPVADTDYQANSRTDGSGDDLTASVTVTLPHTAEYSGRGTVVRVTNGHTSSTAYLTLLRLMADRTYEALEATSYRAEDAGGQAVTGRREVTVRCRYIDNYEAARSGAEARLAHRKTARSLLLLTIPGVSGANLHQLMHRVLGDRVRVVGGNPAVDADFFIEGMEVRAVARSGEVTARWLVEEA